MKLTDKEIRAAKVRDKPYKLMDGNGLFILVHPNGSKYWRLRYFIDGKEKLTGIGKYPDISLKEARDRAYLLKMDVRRGINPVETKRAEKAAQIAEKAQSFKALADDYITMKRKHWTERYTRDVESIMRRDVFPVIGDKALADLQPGDVLKLLKVIEDRGAIIQARKVRSRISEVLNYGIALGVLQHNVADKLANVLQKAEHGHNPFLQASELPAFLDELARYNGSVIIRSALWLIVYTGCRTKEARLATWEQFDLQAGTWTRPPAVMKNRLEHTVSLPRQAVAMLERLHKVTGEAPLVFPGRSNMAKPINPQSLNNALYLMGYKDKLSPHGIRSTISTILHQAGYDSAIIESQLSHIDLNTVRRAYNHSDYLPQRARMMQDYADWLDSIRTGQADPLAAHNHTPIFPNLSEVDTGSQVQATK